jgi:hypothetical protein
MIKVSLSDSHWQALRVFNSSTSSRASGPTRIAVLARTQAQSVFTLAESEWAAGRCHVSTSRGVIKHD